MRVTYVLLIAAVMLLSSLDETSAVESVKHLKMETAHQIQPEEPAFNGNRFLRMQETIDTNIAEMDDEERASWSLKNLLNLVKFKKATNDFAKADLDKMLSNPTFKLEMFERWHKYSTKKILAKLDISKTKNIPYGEILQEYLNTYRRAIQ